jgi:flagellar motor switch protein FliN/FliY
MEAQQPTLKPSSSPPPGVLAKAAKRPAAPPPPLVQESAAAASEAKPAAPQTAQPSELGALSQVPMTVHVEVGRTTLTLGEVLSEIEVGNTLRLDRHAGEPVDIYVNGALFARAEVVVVQDQIGVRITEVLDAAAQGHAGSLR